MSLILCQRIDHVMVLTLNRQDKLNALTQPMYAALTDYLNDAELDNEVHAVLIQGSDQCFTAGNDLDDFLAMDANLAAMPVHGFLRRLATFSKPLIAAVAGPAIGIGTTVLLHCDLVYCADNAKLRLPFVNIGLVPEAASSLLLPQRIGRAQAAELLLLGKVFDGDKAKALGLVNQVLPADQLLPYALEQALAVAAQPPQALQATKALLKVDEAAIIATMEAEEAAFDKALQGPEAKAILRAMRQ
ncbi:enoyl-CoA hydratase-related protein [Ferrimonas senticii]|uniref:enoyl-CoA hydratase-related protein n=1 Tax=Ferrimonas senticii TaxID=394566 RepID=UPI0003F7B2F8|nr:enoyl-CoA hydratase-related protein [Ferrimonas senticii]